MVGTLQLDIFHPTWVCRHQAVVSPWSSQAVGDGCEDWCRWVSRPAWLDGPDCSNCDRDQREGQNTTDTTGDSGDTDTKLP